MQIGTELALAAHIKTIEKHREVIDSLDFSNEEDFADARRGFLGTIPNARITNVKGEVVWDLSGYHFLEQKKAPFTVNPSLWRQARLNMHHGLFEVVQGIYQVRGFDLANITFIESESGVIIIDPLTFAESAKAALALYREHRGHREVKAVIYSHSHRDHYGGVHGVIDPEIAKRKEVPIIAPDGFMEEAISEAVLAGVPMRRRAEFQFGPTLDVGPTAQVDSGLGKNLGKGSYALIPPTWLIKNSVEHHVIDGVSIVFQLTPGTEAPAEMNFYFPSHRALNLAENACHTMHNLCPLRGAKTRDTLAWARYIDEAIDLYGADSDVVFAQHHWPIWGTEKIKEFMCIQRDMYRFLHDQTLRLMSHGLTPREIAAELLLPNKISKSWHARGYYGAVPHNVAAIYAHYMGPYEGNPITLDRLPPVEIGKKYIEYMGGRDEVLKRAQYDLDRGEFSWVAEVMSHLVFADPSCQSARDLEAAALEQMGYQAESATWRNSYLLGARELRIGKAQQTVNGNLISPDLLAVLPISQFLDTLAIRLDGLKVQQIHCCIDWVTPDEKTSHKITISNGAFSHLEGSHGAQADAVIHVSRHQLGGVLQGKKRLYQAVVNDEVNVIGNKKLLEEIFLHLDDFNVMFNIMEP